MSSDRTFPTQPPPSPSTMAQKLRAAATEARLRARREEQHARDLESAAASLEVRR